jgi:catechol 2,3-dioxygenase-like lactoylglutathione lyase family enzyme
MFSEAAFAIPNLVKTLGLRHLALHVKDPAVSKDFYTRVLKMELEWEPDADNIYLTSGGQDNLALHRAKSVIQTSAIDHMGFALPTSDDVDVWYEWIKGQNVPIASEIKTHRDGARSFYIRDPDGIGIQMIYHPPIAERAQKSESNRNAHGVF